MKTFKIPNWYAAGIILALLMCGSNGRAASDSNSAQTANTPGTSAQQPSEPVKLSSAAEDILKLSRAKISDDVTVAFVQNSRHVYPLSASEIIYLREKGVSDRVIRTMLSQTQRLAQTAAQKPAPAAVAAPAPDAAQAAAPQYVTAPAPASSVYVIPDSTSYVYDYPWYYSSYYYSPWYYPYYGYRYCYPGISIGFGFGNGCYYRGGSYCGSRYYGGYRGSCYTGYRGISHSTYRGGYSGGVHLGGARSGPVRVSHSWSGGGRSGGSHFGSAGRASFASSGFSRGGGGGRGHR